jgi:1,4-dihydroxy-6-naphthoate synthase
MKTIRVAHSPDSDDAFMFYALATDKIDTGEFKFVHHLDDIETLNQEAARGTYEVTAVSIHAYAYLAEQYALLNSGASMGEGYGPILVSKEPVRLDELLDRLIAVPGTQTSASLALQLFLPNCQTVVHPFDQIIDVVKSGVVDAGVLIHEGQLFYREYDLRKIVDLGEWWSEETGLPLPLGGNVIRRDLGPEAISTISDLIKSSIQYSLDNREEALDYAMQFGRGLDKSLGDRFVHMYVNSRTIDYGDEGRRAVQLFLDKGFEKGLIPQKIEVEFIGK